MSAPAVPVSVVVPTLGESPHLGRCLEALRADGGEELEIVLVVQGQGEAAAALSAELRARVDRWIALPDNRGFTGGTNRGFAAARGALLATVNDDAVVQPGWLAALRSALLADPGAAAAQGVNLDLRHPEVVDGRGLAWNRWWQAVQVGRGEAPPPVHGAVEEVFGVSATAALYRRSALTGVARGGQVFDERLGSWYEDAELAVRLRRAGRRALSVDAARALHAGSATGARRAARRGALLYGNRWLVAADLLGRRFPGQVPRLLLRDLLDVAHRPSLASAVLLGWARAARRLPGWTHRGPAVKTTR